MRKLTFSLFLSCWFCTGVFAQAYGWREVCSPTDSLRANAYIASICADPVGNIYAAGNFTNANGKRYVAKWNGSIWSEVCSSTDSLNANNSIAKICSDTLGNIYAGGYFKNSANKQYIAKWNGTNWGQVCSLADSLDYNWIGGLACDRAGNLYAGVTRITGQVNVFKWDGNSWTELGGVGSSFQGGQIEGMCLDDSGNVYVTGSLIAPPGYTGPPLLVSAYKWNGQTWTGIGSLAPSGFWTIYYDEIKHKLYGTGTSNPFDYVYEYQGNNGWTQMGNGCYGESGGRILALICDANGNLMAGDIDSCNNMAPYYIGKYSNGVWSDTKPYFGISFGPVSTFCRDKYGNVYAAGGISGSTGFAVIEYSMLNSVQELPADIIQLTMVPNPATNITKINTSSLGLNNLSEFHIQLINVLGQRMETSFQVRNKEILLNVAELENGIYSIEISNGKALYRGKIIVQH